MKLFRIIILCFLLQRVIVLPLHAGTIEGRVMCRSGKPCSLTAITVVGQTRVNTDSNGYYSLNLGPGRYDVIIKGKKFTISVYPYDTPRDFHVRCQ